MRSAVARARSARGMTLVELMISMVLGLIVTGGAISVVLANKQSYRTTEALSQVQESGRTAFEIVARDVRQAGATGCDNTGRVANVLNSATPAWWQSWSGLRGYDGATTDPAVAFGTAVAQRVNGTDSIQLQGTEGVGFSIESHNPSSANIKISAATTNLVANDILILCDFDHAAIFQVTNYNSSNVTLVHNTGTGSPGNCSKGLGYPTDCSSTNGNPYAFGPNSQIARFAAVDWYVGNNGRAAEGGRSLYRRRLGGSGALVTEEVVAGVRDLQVTYRVAGATDFVAATSIAAGNWVDVNAVSITLTLDSADQRIATSVANDGRLQRTFTNVVTLRNRVP